MNKLHISLLLIIQSNNNHRQELEKYLKADSQKAVNYHWFNTQNQSIKIATIREILKLAAFASYSNKKRYFILLNADKATIPAQNALLKLLEEPPSNTQIVLTASQIEKLLPTIQSRCVVKRIGRAKQLDSTELGGPKGKKIIKLARESGEETNEQLIAKLTSFKTYSECIDLAERYKDRGEAQAFVLQLLQAYQEQNQQQPSAKNTAIIKYLLEALGLLERNVNVRLVLERCFFKTIEKL